MVRLIAYIVTRQWSGYKNIFQKKIFDYAIGILFILD